MELKKVFLVLFIVITFIFNIRLLNHTGFLKKITHPDKELIIFTESFTPYFASVSAHPQNFIYFKTKINYPDGTPAKFRRVHNKVFGQGKVEPEKSFTNKDGEIIFYFQPNSQETFDIKEENKILIQSGLKDNYYAQIEFALSPIPVIFVHGYRDDESSFDHLNLYLSESGFYSFKLNYDSTAGIDSAANELSEFIQQKKEELFYQGNLINKFTIISHSYGGLVSRYYTSSLNYLHKRNDIHKLIFLSVPHKGTPLATLGRNIFDDETINELSPYSPLFTSKFPFMMNKGLNPDIQVGNIIVQYDEVVSSESSELDLWNIPTLMFHIGEDKRSIDTIIKGYFFANSNHQLILQNQKVFEKVYEMLLSKLPYPSKIQ
jgi:pimeloyl-ACP methyl ester carboxylesterase